MLVIRRRRVREAWPVRSLFKLDRQSRPLPRPLTSRVGPVQAAIGVLAIPIGADLCR